MNFIVYDLIFLATFLVFLFSFLYVKRENIKRDGLLILYRASWGIKFMNFVGKRFSKSLYFFSYISIFTGYVLMLAVIYLVGRIVYIYASSPEIVRAIKAPPIIPLVPYIDKIIDVPFFPPFYFTFWVIIIAVVAISHEFSHGIFMRRYNIKIKSTGFAFFPWFFPIFPAAFVEQDEKSMNRTKKFEQMAVLSAGTFANLITAVLFFGVLWIFFALSFAPSGVSFDTYAYSLVGVSAINQVNEKTVENSTYERILELTNEEELNKIKTDNGNYVSSREFLENQENNKGILILYYDAPAINSGIGNVILEIDGEKTRSLKELQNDISSRSPGDKILIRSLTSGGKEIETEITLGENPSNKGTAWLGIGFVDSEPQGNIGKIYSKLNFKEKNIYYEPNFDAALFIYNLLWWLILISLSVALVNMLPVGIFDGGRFFYLTVAGLTKNENIARKSFAFFTYLILFLIFVLMFFWVKSFF
ncbi:MAG TPA: site-2 protease family protein [Candidatus Nanoarchaeia archaeon]|nr:site-2 protease family protein [Candidatus Nanoarchaeia archaeon]